ncbi:uncharacterized protein LOC132868360 isoform X1 [Neoarius graeffei]|uniref:uncharacterized protein LOC132868360 isoform X1 n=1 Tax=Neoarius graeffei TaxID=443677 RepID=UPI00298BCE20|nr:uncharacterized protein LOC132868360 isoform X1 [Neoarius graeffei]
MQDVFGILLMFTGAASGLLFQDPVVCRFNETKQCFVALGQQLHLKIPLEERLRLQFISETSGARFIFRYRKADSLPPRLLLPRWQFVNDNKTLILSSVERNNSGKYTLFTFDANGNTKGEYNLQLIIEAKVSSVKVSCSCLATEVMKVDCSADGDNLRFTWTSDSNTFLQLKNENRSFELVKDDHGNVTCHVENHVSRETDTTELCSCPEPTTPTTTSTMMTSTRTPTTPSFGMNSTVSTTETNIPSQAQSTTPPSSNSNQWLLKYILIILTSVCMILIMVVILALYKYKKKQNQKNKGGTSQDGRELVYAQVSHLPTNRREPRSRTSGAQDDETEYAMVVPQNNRRKQQKKTEDEVQYGELVFNTAAKNKRKTPKEQDDCVYSQVQHCR